jgi:hypothetical protein
MTPLSKRREPNDVWILSKKGGDAIAEHRHPTTRPIKALPPLQPSFMGHASNTLQRGPVVPGNLPDLFVLLR